jgi:hypothetical protein
MVNPPWLWYHVANLSGKIRWVGMGCREDLRRQRSGIMCSGCQSPKRPQLERGACSGWGLLRFGPPQTEAAYAGSWKLFRDVLFQGDATGSAAT